MDDAASTAEAIGDPRLGSLDASHLATACALRTDLTAFVGHDERLREPASALGLAAESPA